MLVTFETKAYANLTYFGDIAKQLLRMMGHSGAIPGALVASDVPGALERLQQALALQDKTETAGKNHDDADDKETPVSIGTRALPLIDLLHAAAKEKCDVMWR